VGMGRECLQTEDRRHRKVYYTTCGIEAEVGTGNMIYNKPQTLVFLGPKRNFSKSFTCKCLNRHICAQSHRNQSQDSKCAHISSSAAVLRFDVCPDRNTVFFLPCVLQVDCTLPDFWGFIYESSTVKTSWNTKGLQAMTVMIVARMRPLPYRHHCI
jgi:hypothetical protein